MNGQASHGPPGGSVYRSHMKKYRLEQFTFLKLLGKGSFGKVCTQLQTKNCTHMYMTNLFTVHRYMYKALVNK